MDRYINVDTAIAELKENTNFSLFDKKFQDTFESFLNIIPAENIKNNTVSSREPEQQKTIDQLRELVKVALQVKKRDCTNCARCRKTEATSYCCMAENCNRRFDKWKWEHADRAKELGVKL